MGRLRGAKVANDNDEKGHLWLIISHGGEDADHAAVTGGRGSLEKVMEGSFHQLCASYAREDRVAEGRRGTEATGMGGVVESGDRHAGDIWTS